jgi:predicted RND superfamily exporter protein
MSVNIPLPSGTNAQLTSLVTATAAAIAAGFAAFGHTSLGPDAKTAFIAVAGLIVAVIHNNTSKPKAVPPVTTIVTHPTA